MPFYRLRDATLRSNGWPWGMSVVPSPMSAGERCPLCGKGRVHPGTYPAQPLEVHTELGVKWPDIMGNAWSLTIVSERVVADWHTAGITGFRPHPMTIGSVKGKLGGVPPPAYYHLEIIGRCSLRLEEMGARIVKHCPLCGHTRYERANQPDGTERYDLIIDEATWDGSDLFISPFFPGVPLCTPRVMAVAAEREHTNFCFIDPNDPSIKSPCLKYLPRNRRPKLAS